MHWKYTWTDCSGRVFRRDHDLTQFAIGSSSQTNLKHIRNQHGSTNVSTGMVVPPSILLPRHVSAGQNDKSRVTTTKWRIFLNSCLEARLSLVRFEATTKLLHRTHRVPSSKLSDILRNTQIDSGASVDPLLPAYIARLLQLDILHAPSLLATVIKCRRARLVIDSETDAVADSTSSKFSPQLELCLLNAAVKHSQTHGFAKSRQATMVLLKQIKVLLSLLSQSEMIEVAKVLASSPQDADGAALVVAAGNWTVTVFENAGIAADVHDVLSDGMLCIFIVRIDQ